MSASPSLKQLVHLAAAWRSPDKTSDPHHRCATPNPYRFPHILYGCVRDIRHSIGYPLIGFTVHCRRLPCIPRSDPKTAVRCRHNALPCVNQIIDDSRRKLVACVQVTASSLRYKPCPVPAMSEFPCTNSEKTIRSADIPGTSSHVAVCESKRYNPAWVPA